MANMIKFYRGLVNNLPTTGENGALYITTDEGAIYYGTGTGMKRLGDFIQVANVASLPEKAHESCLYYCVAENILAKWNGTEWKQINKQPTAEEMKTLLGLGSLAYLSEVAEDNLNADLKAKVNAAAEGNHAHANKTVLDGITAEKVAAWDASEKNAKDYADGLDGAMDTRVKAVEAAIGENGSVATQIKTAIEALDFTDTAVDGEYVSAVNEVDGKISVTRKALPDYSNTYDAKGAAATAFDNAKAYADGLAANYDEKGAAAGVKTELEAEIAKKVDKVNGYSLVSDTEIERLAGVNNYDETWLGDHEAFKVESLGAPITTLTEAVANISDRAGKISTIAASYNNGGYELGPVMSATEGVANLNIKAKTEIDAIDGRVGTINDIANSYNSGYNLGPVASTTEAIANLNTAVKADIDDLDGRVGNVADISNSYNSGYNLGPVQSTTEAIANLNIKAKTEIDKKADAEATTNALNGKVDKVEGYSLVSDTEIARLADVDNYDDEEVRGLIGDNAKAIEDLEKYVGTIPATATATDIVAYVQEKTAGIATDAALEELTGRVADLETESAKHAIKTEVEGALALKADKSALEATDKTLADVKTTVDNFFADDAAINDTIDTLKEIANYIATDKEGAADITRRVGILEGKVDVDKVSEAIDADVKAAIDAEVLRANGAYDAKGAAADAQAAAEAAAAGALASARTEITAEIGTAISGEVSRADGKYEEKGVAQGIVDALKLGDTYEPIGAEGRAIAAAKTETENQVKALAGEGNTSTVKKNADDIASLFEQFQWGEF